ncbi:MAG TPA: hypothetical protein VJ386_04595 [Candidatus Deferrimicrobiaceae bacterium]|jgi:hypothetical protein|nr:hypothetical protein [Candidatus Deferrimicrobiaceae bacterium]
MNPKAEVDEEFHSLGWDGDEYVSGRKLLDNDTARSAPERRDVYIQ